MFKLPDIISPMIERLDSLLLFIIAVFLLLKPRLMQKFDMHSLRWKKKFFKGTNMENFTNDAYDSAKKDPQASVISARFLSVILLLFAIAML